MSFPLKDGCRQEVVGVIMTHSDLARAVRMRNPPNLFELRLDTLYPRTEEVMRQITDLSAPLIVTARHRQEGGSKTVPPRLRGTLIRLFLPKAAYIDVELRSARRFAAVLREARAKRIRTIISFHDLKGTPSSRRLDRIALDAQSLGADVVKVATRTDRPEQLERLMDFFLRMQRRMRIAAMGIGRLGRISRMELAKCGSALNYVHFGGSNVEGQLSFTELRRILE